MKKYRAKIGRDYFRLLRFSSLRKLSLLIIIALNCNFISGQTSDIATDNQIDKIFSKYNSKTSGAAVAVVKDGKIVFKKGYGTANLEYDIPISTKTIFNIASVSKQFTAFAVYLLEKQEKLSLEDDIRKYIPEIPDYGKTVKIKHLLAHTSGIRDQASLVSLAGWRPGDLVTTENVLRFISRQKELNFETRNTFFIQQFRLHFAGGNREKGFGTIIFGIYEKEHFRSLGNERYAVWRRSRTTHQKSRRVI